jgi:hypothetical protein
MSEKDELEAYFRAQTNIRLASIEEKMESHFEKINAKLDRSIGFEKMIIGGSVAVSTIVSIAIAILFGR